MKTSLLLLITSLFIFVGCATTSMPTFGVTKQGVLWEVGVLSTSHDYTKWLEAAMEVAITDYEKVTGKKVPANVWSDLRSIKIFVVGELHSITTYDPLSPELKGRAKGLYFKYTDNKCNRAEDSSCQKEYYQIYLRDRSSVVHELVHHIEQKVEGKTDHTGPIWKYIKRHFD